MLGDINYTTKAVRGHVVPYSAWPDNDPRQRRVPWIPHALVPIFEGMR